MVNTILGYMATVKQKEFITHGRSIFKLTTHQGVDIGKVKSFKTALSKGCP